MSLDSFFVGSTDGWTLLTTLGLACVTVVARSFFFITDKDWSLPAWAQPGHGPAAVRRGTGATRIGRRQVAGCAMQPCNVRSTALR